MGRVEFEQKEVEKCYRMISDVVSSNKKRSKRKNWEMSGSSWSSDVIIIDDAVMNSDSANHSWEEASHPIFKTPKT